MRRGLPGNLILLALLLALAILLGFWQGEAWTAPRQDPLRMIAVAVAGVAWLLWLLAVRYKRERKGDAAASGDTLLLAWASQTGFAERLAEHSAETLRAVGVACRVLPIDAVDAELLRTHRRALFIASTTGEGDPPDHALAFTARLQDASLAASTLQYAVLALGDRRYAHFCAFGRQLDERLRQLHATPLFDRVEVDAGDAAALRHWQQQLAQLGDGRDATIGDWIAPAYARWQLRERVCLNPGSSGAPAHRLWLMPPQDSLPQDATHTWQAGDIAEIGPRHAPETVVRWLAATGFDDDVPTASVAPDDGDGRSSLSQRLASSRLPAVEEVRGLGIEALLARLQRLPHREYSIASIPSEGALQLLVREQHDGKGRPGLGSGWLCRHAAIGGDIDLRIRRNPAFHAPDPRAPMLLIGNGTGIAGLRAHLAARVAAQAAGNWLLFGERHALHDLHFGEDLRRWQQTGQLSRLDLVFSRDGGPERYVQERLRAEGERLRAWINRGATVYVCGSLQGMAPAVDAAMQAVLGEAACEQLRGEGRYRRDVY